MNYQTITLGSEARKHVLNRLQMGLTMAQFILTEHDIETGTVTTCFDDFVDARQIQEMTVERLFSGKVSDTGLSVDCLIDNIVEHLSKDLNNICMLESFADPEFPFMKRTTLPYKVHEKEVYFVLTVNRCSRREIDESIGKAQSAWLFIGAMTSVSDISSWEGKMELSEEDLEDLAARTEKVFVVAFDEEGYLYWSKPEVPT